ncbi:MAG: GNAT family N-acetyltransferase [Anaerolineales bacterium]|nr:MAG: GNAT family N-acetyltransferase [Anaerolineales bacterium]
MKIDIIRNTASWATLQQEWDALLQKSHLNLPFLTFAFQQAWWQHLGGGEWQDAELHIITGRGEDGALLGIAPLFRTPDGQLYLIGSHEIADYLDFIARPQDLDAFVQAVLEALKADEGWAQLTLYNILDESKTIESVQAAAQAAGLQAAEETLQPCPYIALPENFDAYLESLDSKQAHELRRKMRKAARNVLPVSTELISEAGGLDQALDDFFGLMTQEEDKLKFLTPAMRVQMEAIARAAFAGGWLQLVFLKVGMQRAAAYMNFDYDNRIWGYNAGFSNAHAQLSPGWLMMAEMMQRSIEEKKVVFDFMRGDEEYKYRFGAVNRFVKKVTIRR